MPRPRPSSRPRALEAARALAWIAGAALAAARPAGATDLAARADLTWGEDETPGAASSYLRQTYKLDYRRQVTEPTSYQLTLRYRDDRGDLTALGVRSDLRYRLLEPTASLQHRMDAWGLALSYRRNEEENLSPELGRWVHRTIERISTSLYVRPFEDGEVSVYGDRLAFRTSSVDTRDDRTGIMFRYTSGTFRLENEFRLQRQEDRVAQLSRTSIGPRVTATWARTFAGGSTFSTQYVLDYFLTQQDALATAPVFVPVEVQFASGLFTLDNLPTETGPMSAEPRLVDRNFDASAGVALGPGGSSFNNLGLDMGRFVELDELRVHVRDAAGGPIALGGSITWTAYSSQDGLRWVEIDGALTAFDAGLSAYVVAFPPLSARFFKIVNFGVTTIEAYVTELQPFVHEAIQPYATRRGHSLRQGVSVSLTGRLTPKLSLDYSGLLNADLIAPDRGPNGWYTDVTNGATATIGPFGDFLYTAAETFTIAQEPGGIRQTSSVTSGSVRFRPIPRYDTTLAAQVGRQHFDAAAPAASVSTTDVRATLWNRLDPYDALRLGLGGGAGRQTYAGGASTDYVLGSAYAHADLTAYLWLRLQSNLQWSVAGQEAPPPGTESLPIVRVVSYQIHTLEARWQPNVQLTLVAKLGYVRSYAGEGPMQSYQANWSPFPGGAVQLAFYYSQEIDPLTARSLRRVSATPRWQINKHAQLQLSYNNTQGTGEPPVRQESVFLMFSLVL